MDRPSSDLPSSRNLFKQSQRNLATRDAWERFEPHRTRVTQLLDERAGAGGGTLGVLGAGNCNDLDLRRLSSRFREIHLLDCDSAALAHGLNWQGLTKHAAIKSHGAVDLSGIAEILTGWNPLQAPSDDEIAAAIQTAEGAYAPLPADSLDVAASICLLSQLLEGVSLALAATHPRFLDLVAAIRRRHLGMMVEMLRPGGQGLLVTDVVSSETVPDLRDLSRGELASTLARLVQDRNFFTGLNPSVILTLLARDSVFGSQVRALKPISPWLWDLGPRQYIVFAIGFERRP